MSGTPKLTDGRQAPAKGPPLWPSLLFSAVVATFFSLLWLTRGPKLWFDFRILLAPIYIPLGFGILWPVTVGLQALATPAARDGKLRRNWVAMILFAVSGLGWVPIVTAEWAESVRKRVEAQRQIEWIRHQQLERETAQAALARGGLLAFTEPLKGQEGVVLDWYIYEHRLSAEELREASEHYRTPQLMAELAEKPDCPPEALKNFFEHATEQQRSVAEALAPSVLGPVFSTIGKHGNTPTDVLVRMVRSDSPYVRMAAVDNPNLPKAAKMTYLKKGCDYWWPAELRTVGGDPDTPLDVLLCLSTKPDAAYSVARNPHTPTSVVEAMSKSENYWLKTAGKENLAKRQAVAK